jgi:hypothetical protein
MCIDFLYYCVYALKKKKPEKLHHLLPEIFIKSKCNFKSFYSSLYFVVVILDNEMTVFSPFNY